MNKYKVSYTYENYYYAIVEAENKDEALHKFDQLNFDHSTVTRIGSELQDSIEIEESDEV